MTNIVLLAKDRHRLTEQCLRTLYMNTPHDQFNLVTIDDGSWPETKRVIQGYHGYANHQIVTLQNSIGIVGFLRNLGAQVSEKMFGRGDWLYMSDNDVVFQPQWLDRMIDRLTFGGDIGVKVLGGYRHPFHGVLVDASTERMFQGEGIECTDAVAGYSHLMSWATWDEFGPYDSHAKGVCQSEDFAFCQKIVKTGGLVGYIEPPVIAVCGVTSTGGKPAVGHESIPRIPGLVYE